MANIKNTDAIVLQVYSTKDYAKFSLLEGNRDINLFHLNRLRASIKAMYLVTILIVNEKFQIIDGQHRFEICKESNLDVLYVIYEGSGLKHVQIYNLITKNWTMDDFLHAYIQRGKLEYALYKEFKELYRFGHTECLQLLTVGNSGNDVRAFQAGKLRIKDYDEACRIADKVYLTSEYYKGWKRSSFVRTLIQLMKIKAFKMEEFILKLRFQQTKMVDCSTVEQYIPVIEEIYNYKRKSDEKLDFRYELKELQSQPSIVPKKKSA